MRQRIESLDYLRGIMALSVMIYHYSGWGGFHSGILDKLGIYAVSTFYALSGASLYTAYVDRIRSRSEIARYIVNRVFRIFPLFWVATIFSALMLFPHMYYEGVSLGRFIFKILINLSLLFGFVDPPAYIATGAWSIGNEMVFYAIFPILLLAGWRSIFPALLLSAAVAAGFAFFWLSGNDPLPNQWVNYINPFNQILFFVTGVAVAKLAFRPTGLLGKISCYIIFFALAALLYVMPYNGNQLDIVIGFRRFEYYSIVAGLVMCAYAIDISNRSLPGRVLDFIGKSSYSIYLLHPLVRLPIVYLGGIFQIESTGLYIASIFATLILSYFSYKYLEIPMVRFGKGIAARIQIVDRGCKETTS